MDNTVDHPSHYTSGKVVCRKCGHKVECIDVTETFNFSLGNSIKYIWRADLKNNAIEDLKKARWYITREIETREKEVYNEVIKEQAEGMAQGSCCIERGGEACREQSSTREEGKIKLSEFAKIPFTVLGESNDAKPNYSGFSYGTNDGKGHSEGIVGSGSSGQTEFVGDNMSLTSASCVNYNHGSQWGSARASGWDLFLKGTQ